MPKIQIPQIVEQVVDSVEAEEIALKNKINEQAAEYNPVLHDAVKSPVKDSAPVQPEVGIVNPKTPDVVSTTVKPTI